MLTVADDEELNLPDLCCFGACMGSSRECRQRERRISSRRHRSELLVHDDNEITAATLTFDPIVSVIENGKSQFVPELAPCQKSGTL
jgi:hypothetical protein